MWYNISMSDQLSLHTIDPVPAFRRFAYLWLVLMLLTWLSSYVNPDHVAPDSTIRLCAVIHALILVVFLSIPQLRRRWPALYLPIALGIALAGPMILMLMGPFDYVSSIFAKLQVADRAQAVVIALRHGLA
jgi:hypothetical protein